MRVRILGIDPGIAIVGFGLIEAERGQTKLLNYGAITTPAGLSVERDYTRLDQLLSSLEFQNDFFPVYNILLFKNDRYFSSYFDPGIRIIGTRIPIRPYPIPITPELKREAELIWSLKPVMCFDINVFPGSILWIKTEDNRWLVVNQETEQVSDAQTYLDSLDADKLRKEIEQKNAIPIQNRYLWDYCKIGPDGKVIEWTKRFY